MGWAFWSSLGGSCKNPGNTEQYYLGHDTIEAGID
jgi:hypothetical protein